MGILIRSHKRNAMFAAAALAVGASLVGAGDARADDVSPSGKGIVGGGLLGAEVVTIVESIAGVRSGWAYGIGAVVGAAGGAVGGYFVEQGSSDGRAPVYMLAGGMALIIPAIVLTLNATRYMPDATATQDTTPVDVGPTADPGTPAGPTIAPPTTPPPATQPDATPKSTTAPGGGALFHLTVDPRTKVAAGMGVPVPTIKPMWSQTEQKELGMAQGTEVRMPLVRVAF
jgi:hypothetical protein